MTMPHNSNLEQLFNLAEEHVADPGEPLVDDEGSEPDIFMPELPVSTGALTAIEKVEAALPLVRDMQATDSELDELAKTALDGYKDLVDLGMNVDARAAAEILSVASSMLGHAITAKTTKINKKLKMIELQLKKAKLDQDRGEIPPETAQGHVFDRNELIAMLKQKPQ